MSPTVRTFVNDPSTLAKRRIALLFLGLSLYLCGHPPAWTYDGVVEVDRVVAIVNDDVIVASELKERLDTLMGELRRSGTRPPPMPVLKKQVLERLILERLQIHLARRTGMQVDDETLNRTIIDMARKNGMELREFRDVLERDGYDFAAFREDIRQRLLIAQVQKRQVGNRIRVSEREIENLLAMRFKPGAVRNEYHLAHILIAVPEAPSPAQIAAGEQRAQGVVQRLRDGADFAETAVGVSDGQQALQGGDLGWRKATEIPTLFAELVPNMAQGDVSDPIRSPSGFHIIKLVETRGGERHIITQTKARHILVKTGELTSDADAKTRLGQLRERIIDGESFHDLARSHSDDRGSAMDGGELGWLSPGDVVPQFEQEMAALQPGEVSAPFRSQFGWHIVEVLERRDYDGTVEVRRAKAAEQIRQRKGEEELQSWLRQLRDEAYVEYRLEE